MNQLRKKIRDYDHLPSYSDKSEWPWNRTHSSKPYDKSDELPTISVICPSFNQGQFLEETLRSILLQEYPKLELFVMDGGSTDDSVGVIRKYEKWITHWRSEKDGGQVFAIQEAFKKCTGQIINHINSDDYMAENSLWKIAENYKKGYGVVAGVVKNFGLDNRDVVQKQFDTKSFLNNETVFHQPGTWIARNLIQRVGGWDTSFRYCFDLDLIIRVVLLNPKILYHSSETFAFFRVHGSSSTVNQQTLFDRERLRILEKLEGLLSEERTPLWGKCRNRLRTAKWQQEISELEKLESKTKKLKALVTRFPSYLPQSLSRFTLGAIRNILLSKG